jgi:hypothetical protein
VAVAEAPFLFNPLTRAREALTETTLLLGSFSTSSVTSRTVGEPLGSVEQPVVARRVAKAATRGRYLA